MKKAINKSERNHIITAMVVQSAGDAAQIIFDEFAKLRQQVGEILANNWIDHFPGISAQDQLALLQSGGANRLTFKPNVYGKGDEEGTNKSLGEFGRLAWTNSGTDTEKNRISMFASRIFENGTGTSGVISDGVSNGWTSYIYMYATFNHVIHGNHPTSLYDASLDVPKEFSPALNDALVSLHGKMRVQLTKLKELIFSCEVAWQALATALAPVKTGDALAELMPEAVKFFPPSLTYVKPTKELADPKAINEIRAKLKKGLPI